MCASVYPKCIWFRLFKSWNAEKQFCWWCIFEFYLHENCYQLRCMNFNYRWMVNRYTLNVRQRQHTHSHCVRHFSPSKSYEYMHEYCDCIHKKLHSLRHCVCVCMSACNMRLYASSDTKPMMIIIMMRMVKKTGKIIPCFKCNHFTQNAQHSIIAFGFLFITWSSIVQSICWFICFVHALQKYLHHHSPHMTACSH